MVNKYTKWSIIIGLGLIVSLAIAGLLIYFGLIGGNLLLFYSGIGFIAVAAIFGVISGVRQYRRYGGEGP